MPTGARAAADLRLDALLREPRLTDPPLHDVDSTGSGATATTLLTMRIPPRDAPRAKVVSDPPGSAARGQNLANSIEMPG